jgi:hypothetical protein
VLAAGNGGARVSDARRRMAGRLDNHLDIAAPGERAAVLDKARGGDSFVAPAYLAAGGAGAIGSEIGDSGHFEARCGRHLGEEHGAELPGANQTHTDRPPGALS